MSGSLVVVKLSATNVNNGTGVLEKSEKRFQGLQQSATDCLTTAELLQQRINTNFATFGDTREDLQ